MFRLQSETRGEQTALIDEMVGSQKVVQAFGHEKQAWRHALTRSTSGCASCSLRAIFFSSITNPCHPLCQQPGLYAAWALSGALSAVSGGAYRGQLTSFLSYANQYTKPFNEISGVVTELQNALGLRGAVCSS